MTVFQDECSFVSLRDVERTLKVMAWFYRHRALLFELMANMEREELEQSGVEEEEIENERRVSGLSY